MLGPLSRRTEIEERLSQAKASWRHARAELSRIEARLGQRALDVEERIARRAAMKPWLRTALGWFGALPDDTDDRRWQAAQTEIELQKQAVTAVEHELDTLRELEKQHDELLAELGAKLDRSRQYVEQLDAAYEVAVEGQQRASAAVTLFVEAEASTLEEGKGDDEGAQYGKTSELLTRAGAQLADASAQFALCNESTLAGVLVDVSSRAAAAGMWQPVSGKHDLATIGALRDATGSALDVAAAFLLRLGNEVTRARSELKTLREQRDQRLRELNL
ncbi:MAG: hypothetical protein M3020_15580 [Myxococcota bacterium]|nr:hypothetical protein [Myxococcota bacterium]